MTKRRNAEAALVVALAVMSGAARAETSTRETIIFVRHGEKPGLGLGQLNCQGLNRALALPSVIEAKFGKPNAVFAPDPSKQKDDVGKPYDYIRPLATVEPTAIRFGLPVDTTYGFTEVDQLQAALERPNLHGATVLVGWEHKLIDVAAKALVAAHGGSVTTVPKWHSSDFDSIYVVTITWTASGSSVAFDRAQQGLNDQPTTCPK